MRAFAGGLREVFERRTGGVAEIDTAQGLLPHREQRNSKTVALGVEILRDEARLLQRPEHARHRRFVHVELTSELGHANGRRVVRESFKQADGLGHRPDFHGLTCPALSAFLCSYCNMAQWPTPFQNCHPTSLTKVGPIRARPPLWSKVAEKMSRGGR